MAKNFRISKFFLLFLLLFPFCSLLAQDNLYIIGFVTDTNGNALSEATIIDVQSKKAISSNQLGVFCMPVKFETTTIKISFIGFQPEIIEINENILKGKNPGDSIPFRIRMRERIIPIQQVDFYAGIEKIHGSPKTIIFDFEFIDSKILILQSENKNRILNLISEGNTKNISLRIPYPSETLFKDCFGNIHLLTSDSIYQIYFISDSLYLGKGFKMMEFDGNLKDMVGDVPAYLLKREYGKYNQTVNYFSFNKATKEKLPFASITDYESERLFEYMAIGKMIPNSVESKLFVMHYQRAHYGELPFQLPVGAANNSNCQLLDSRMTFMRGTFLELLSKPTYVPLFVIRDTIFIFDHTIGICKVFNSDLKSINSFEINYHKGQGWKKNILFDPVTYYLHGYFIRDGMVYLSNINLENGKVNTTTKIINHVYPQKLKVHNGYAYYLYQEMNSNDPLVLYRQKL